MKREKWFAEYARLAAMDDPDAQMELAWYYIRGNAVAQDFDMATALFRRAEIKKPELARFHLAKAKCLRGDSSLAADIAGDCAAGYGPALYIMGAAADAGLLSDQNKENAAHYFALASQRGHLVARFFLWRETQKSPLGWLITLPGAIRLFFEILITKFRNLDDVRVLT